MAKLGSEPAAAKEEELMQDKENTGAESNKRKAATDKTATSRKRAKAQSSSGIFRNDVLDHHNYFDEGRLFLLYRLCWPY